MHYKLLNFSKAGAVTAGVLLEDASVVDAGAIVGGSTTVSIEDLLERWTEADTCIRSQLAGGFNTERRVPVAQLQLLAPVQRGQVYIAGSNYRDHIDEMHRRDLASGMQREAVHLKWPYHAFKGSRACLVGTGARVRRPHGCQKFDWEAELAVIIGRHAVSVPVQNALDYVAGYAIANDLSARDLGRRSDAEKGTTFWVDWIGHKSFAGSGPIGPWLTPKESIADVQALSIKLWVNDVLRQDSNTSNMIFSVAEQIAYLSSRIPLYPGDVILTGTPSGTATSHGGAYLQSGDAVRIQIERLGELVTYIE